MRPELFTNGVQYYIYFRLFAFCTVAKVVGSFMCFGIA